MYERLLVPVDGSEPADVALSYALDVADDDGATVHVLHVADTNRDSVTRIRGEVRDALEQEGEEIVASARERATARGVDVVTEVLQGDPRETIVEYGEEFDVDLVAMGTHGRRGLDRVLLGSVTERVVRTADAPVLAVRRGEDVRTTYPPETVLVPIDGSDHAAAALERAVDVAHAHDATLHVLSVVDVTSLGIDVGADEVVDRMEANALSVVDDAAERARDAGVDDVVTAVESGSIHREIRDYAGDVGADLLVAGTHGRSGVDRFLLGSVTERVLRTAPAPVLTVRARE